MPPTTSATRTTVEGIIAAALHIIDTDGIAALNMRQLGDTLGVTPTTIYRYFRDKGDVLRGISRHMLESVSVPDPTEMTCRDWLMSLARAYFHALAKHPNAVPIMLSYETRAPGLPLNERMLAVLAANGIEPAEGTAIIDTIEAHCFGFGLIATRPTTWREPTPDDAPTMPHLTTAARTRTRTIEEQFERGLAILVDGLLDGHGPKADEPTAPAG